MPKTLLSRQMGQINTDYNTNVLGKQDCTVHTVNTNSDQIGILQILSHKALKFALRYPAGTFCKWNLQIKNLRKINEHAPSKFIFELQIQDDFNQVHSIITSDKHSITLVIRGTNNQIKDKNSLDHVITVRPPSPSSQFQSSPEISWEFNKSFGLELKLTNVSCDNNFAKEQVSL